MSDPPQLPRAEDYGSVRDRRWTLQRRGGRGESHVVLVHVHAVVCERQCYRPAT
ncbi:hypothetical protein [Haladaptatus litoreus]|uniref:hypothetical protein n=1 Tax=Haladaptatus litoreus TaxID=553468 RepID=UPI00158ED888|nr:hypothetical protein [Haladaptatus litoreus]